MMKKALLTLVLTLLALPVYCSTADELQEALDDLIIDCCTTYFPKGEGDGSIRILTSAIFRVDKDTLYTGYNAIPIKSDYVDDFCWKSALKDLSGEFEIKENRVIFEGKKSVSCLAIKQEYIKEYIKKMKNIIKLSKKLEEEKNAPPEPEAKAVPTDKSGKK